MSEKQLLALLTAILLAGQNVQSDEAVKQAVTFARVILKETQ